MLMDRIDYASAPSSYIFREAAPNRRDLRKWRHCRPSRDNLGPVRGCRSQNDRLRIAPDILGGGRCAGLPARLCPRSAPAPHLAKSCLTNAGQVRPPPVTVPPREPPLNKNQVSDLCPKTTVAGQFSETTRRPSRPGAILSRTDGAARPRASPFRTLDGTANLP